MNPNIHIVHISFYAGSFTNTHTTHPAIRFSTKSKRIFGMLHTNTHKQYSHWPKRIAFIEICTQPTNRHTDEEQGRKQKKNH